MSAIPPTLRVPPVFAPPIIAPPVIRPPKLRRDWRYFQPRDLRRFKNLLFASRLVVEGLYAGQHRSPYKGRSPEFVDYREYFPGDEIRTIDWKAYARTDRYFVKLFQQETDMNCYVLLDCSASMDYGGRATRKHFPGAVSKFDYACQLAAALAYLLVKQGDKVSLTTFTDKLGPFLPPGGTFPHLYKVLDTLERQKPAQRTAVAHAVRTAFPLCKRKGLLVVISDLLEDPAELYRALNLYRHRGFAVILLHLLHEHEHRLPPLAHVKFVDAENGDIIRARPADIAAEYEARLGAHLAELAAGARARRIEYQLVTTAAPYSAALERFVHRQGHR